MIYKVKLYLFVTLLCLLGCFCLEYYGHCEPPDDIPSKILVRFREGVRSPARHQALAIPGLKFLRTISRFNIDVLKVQQDLDRERLNSLVKRLRNNPVVEWAEPNFKRYALRVPDDPLFSDQWHLVNSGDSGGKPGADINADKAWDLTVGTSEVVVAVLDTGIDYSHEDLKANMWHNPGEDWNPDGTPGHNGVDDDGNGYVDDYYGIDVVEESQPPPIFPLSSDPMDEDGHGTHVAGIIGAVGNNGVGVAGINWNTSLMALKFIGQGGGDIEGVMECVDYILSEKARGVPIRVVNASYGGPEYSEFEKEAYEALEDAGILLIASAGNSSSDLGESSNYPACYNLPNIISVAATTKDDELAYFSNYGQQVHLAAPGSRILSTYLDDHYELMSGTSMAAPQVTGAVALIYAFMSTADALEAKERVLRGADELESLKGMVLTNGRLNVYNSLVVELSGPFIFSISPTSASPGDEVTVTGVRFGPSQGEGRVLFSGVEAEIVAWTDKEIRCLVPELEAAQVQLVVMVGELASNPVTFYLDLYHRYYLPLAPMEPPWVCYLILTNLNDEAVNVRVMVCESGAYVYNSFEEYLPAFGSVYKKLTEYGLHSPQNLVWVESTRQVLVSALVANLDMTNFVYVKAMEH